MSDRVAVAGKKKKILGSVFCVVAFMAVVPVRAKCIDFFFFFHCSFILNDSHNLYQLEFLIVIYRKCPAILNQKENILEG